MNRHFFMVGLCGGQDFISHFPPYFPPSLDYVLFNSDPCARIVGWAAHLPWGGAPLTGLLLLVCRQFLSSILRRFFCCGFVDNFLSTILRSFFVVDLSTIFVDNPTQFFLLRIYWPFFLWFVYLWGSHHLSPRLSPFDTTQILFAFQDTTQILLCPKVPDMRLAEDFFMVCEPLGISPFIPTLVSFWHHPNTVISQGSSMRLTEAPKFLAAWDLTFY